MNDLQLVQSLDFRDHHIDPSAAERRTQFAGDPNGSAFFVLRDPLLDGRIKNAHTQIINAVATVSIRILTLQRKLKILSQTALSVAFTL